MKSTLKIKLSKNITDTEWFSHLTFSEVLELYEVTKDLPIVNSKIRKYCYLNNITEYPTKDGKYLKFRDGNYGFYKNVFVNNLNFNKIVDSTIIKNKLINNKNAIQLLSYEELLFIKLTIPVDINNICTAFYYFFNDLKNYLQCPVCNKKVNLDNKHIHKAKLIIFCSDKCRLSKKGINIAKETRKQSNLNKYGVEHTLAIPEIRQKIMETNIHKYGIPHAGMLFSKPYSKWQTDLITILKLEFPDLQNVLEKELHIKLSDKTSQLLQQTYIYPDLEYNKKIIEFYGDYWHANPDISKYTDDYILHASITAKEKRAHDSMRIKILEDLGYTVLIIWQNDYKNNQTNIIKKCKEFLIKGVS